MQPILRIGTRKSPLALRQVELVVQALQRHQPELREEGAVVVLPVVTSGDRFLDTTLDAIGGKGLFTKEIEESLLAGDIDIAVHSVKDMQTVLPGGLTLAAVLEREDPRDVLITPDLLTLKALKRGAVVGTASLRREVQVRHLRADLVTQPIRGNIQTRMAKITSGEYDATLLALAGLRRMNIDPLPGVIMETEEMLPAVGQGIIGIECRDDDTRTREMLAAINHTESMLAANCEREMLKLLDGSCHTPIAGYATIDRGMIHLRGMLADPKTGVCQYFHSEGLEPEKLAETVAKNLKLLLENGRE